MQYRKFGKLGFEASALGFGCMRLPTAGGRENIIEEEATRMVRYAIDNGVNYLDTAYPYHGGNSERFLGRALKDGYRERITLATKLPCRMVKVADDFERFLNEQLERLQIEHIDIYLLHGLRTDRWTKVRDLGVLEWAEGAKADGRIGHLGFSFHDELPVFKEIIDAYDDWVMCQIQHNYMNIDHQAGTKGLRYAASKGLAVVVMEPLLGGKLVNPPEQVQQIWDTAETKRSAAEWAFQWLWNQPEVAVALSGMSTMEQVVENVASADAAAVGALTPEELALFPQVREMYDELCPVPCTQCNYCMPCPNGVDIPRNFTIYNQGVMYNQAEQARTIYKGRVAEDARASACIQCRECEEKCPQNIRISEWMPVVDEVLGHGRPYACELP